MQRLPIHRLIDADLMSGSVLITFEDGRMAMYSADLLYDTLPQAEEFFDPDPDADHEL